MLDMPVVVGSDRDFAQGAVFVVAVAKFVVPAMFVRLVESPTESTGAWGSVRPVHKRQPAPVALPHPATSHILQTDPHAMLF